MRTHTHTHTHTHCTCLSSYLILLHLITLIFDTGYKLQNSLLQNLDQPHATFSLLGPIFPSPVSNSHIPSVYSSLNATDQVSQWHQTHKITKALRFFVAVLMISVVRGSWRCLATEAYTFGCRIRKNICNGNTYFFILLIFIIAF